MLKFVTRGQLNAAGVGIRDAFVIAGIILAGTMSTATILQDEEYSERLKKNQQKAINIQAGNSLDSLSK
ncbi:hypothetical protein QQ054_36425 [Oscillatoria amoena NRMC-F 0135]|nr:hypothetical protein [Oscillatoria amoena NRMC-F 0135]